MKPYKTLGNFLLIFILLGSFGCGLKQVATQTTAQIFYDATPSIDQEDDVALARTASLSFLKMLEGLYRENPKDKVTLFLLTKSYAGYAFGFTENNLLAHKDSVPQAYKKDLARVRRFYSRAKRYGLELLKLLPGMGNAADGTLDEFQAALKRQGSNQVENLFWIGFAWGNYLNFHKDDVEAIAAAPKMEALMRRVLELNPNYYYGGADLFMGAYYGSRPKLLGGNPNLAKEYFDKAIQVTNGKNLMAPVAKAQFYAVQVQDSSLYNRLLNEVLTGDPSALPEIRLLNELAIIRARILLDKKSLFFAHGKR